MSKKRRLAKERREFWRDVRRIAAEVRTWPAWKLGTVDRPNCNEVRHE
jgi:hypothetical protein